MLYKTATNIRIYFLITKRIAVNNIHEIVNTHSPTAGSPSNNSWPSTKQRLPPPPTPSPQGGGVISEVTPT